MGMTRRGGYHMNEQKLRLLKFIVQAKTDVIPKSTLLELIGTGTWQLQKYLRELEASGYLINNPHDVRVKINPKVNLMRKLCNNFDITKLLRFSNDLVLTEISKDPSIPVDIICKKANLSRATVYRAFQDFYELGLIENIVKINDKENLIPVLVSVLKVENSND